jgi:hypothetical protein
MKEMLGEPNIMRAVILFRDVEHCGICSVNETSSIIDCTISSVIIKEDD